MSAPITPATTIADMLEAYPALEEVLIRQSPHFKALKNPILRKTVAKVATLAKAAQMSGIPVRALVATLRQAAGLPSESAEDVGAESGSVEASAPAPTWLDEGAVLVSIDADDLLARGEVPLPRIHQALAALPPGALLRVTSAFRPEPLLDALQQAGHGVYVRQAPQGFDTYICRKA